ncbi:MAG: hypothetical protein H7268_05135 [Sandarakinorhabdus sp.]|nr:hypothetical protein [Sandarakinorhabdus sp.]
MTIEPQNRELFVIAAGPRRRRRMKSPIVTKSKHTGPSHGVAPPVVHHRRAQELVKIP